MAVNPNEAPPGYTAVSAKWENNPCRECALNYPEICGEEHRCITPTFCLGGDREDGEKVYFIKDESVPMRETMFYDEFTGDYFLSSPYKEF